MLSKNVIKFIGFLATGIGIGATLLSDWADEKKMEETITEKVNNALSEHLDENEEEEEDEDEDNKES